MPAALLTGLGVRGALVKNSISMILEATHVHTDIYTQPEHAQLQSENPPGCTLTTRPALPPANTGTTDH